MPGRSVPLAILFDRNVPRPLRRHISGHIVRVTEDEGWSTLTNGDLLAAAEQAGYDVLVTGDRNLRYQQNLNGRRLSLVVLSNPAWPVVRANLQRIIVAVDRATPGSDEEVGLPRPPLVRWPPPRA